MADHLFNKKKMYITYYSKAYLPYISKLNTKDVFNLKNMSIKAKFIPKLESVADKLQEQNIETIIHLTIHMLLVVWDDFPILL